MADPDATKIRNTEVLGQWIRFLLIAAIVVSIAAIGSRIHALSLLDEMRAGGESAARIFIEIESRETKILWLQAGVYLLSGILTLVWIHHMNANARALGAEGMRFTPGWAVGWNFVPIFNLWKPYQAMKEIWQAHANPSDWPNQDRPALLPLWWGLWILALSLDRGVNGLERRMETLDDWRGVLWMSAASEVVRIALCVAFIYLVVRLMALQRARLARLG